MKICVIGSGGREHAIAWKLNNESDVDEVFAVPGNPGMERDGITCRAVDHDALAEFCQKHAIDLVVVGPEAPLCDGLVDRLSAKNILAFGPSQRAAELEGSKGFAKKVMRSANVPTADFALFSDLETAIDYVKTAPYDIVIKADGLAGGKGVVLPESTEDAIETLSSFMRDRKFGESSAQVLIEERLSGPELSFMVISDGERFVTLPTSRDYKRLLDDDAGPNTGGMGAVSPAPGVDAEMIVECQSIVRRVLLEMKTSHGGFRGFLYVGLMLTNDGPKILEFNVRLGDPETQALMTALASQPIAQLLVDAARGNLMSDSELVGAPTACVVLASEGYPESPVVGRSLAIPKHLESKIFYAGVREEVGLVSGGGRVLSVVATADALDEALSMVYRDIAEIELLGSHYRRDIGV